MGGIAGCGASATAPGRPCGVAGPGRERSRAQAHAGLMVVRPREIAGHAWPGRRAGRRKAGRRPAEGRTYPREPITFFAFLLHRSRTIATTAVAPPTWTIKDAEKLYNMSGWGLGYFRVSPEGHVTVHPDANRKRGLDLYQLAMDLNAQGVGLPLLLRFSDILRSRIQSLAGEFASAIKEFGYEGTYTTVYPVKVNQQRHVVQEIVEFGAPHGVGLECGSKPELQAMLGLNESTNHLIVCNGYKDEEFMRLALMGQKLGHTVMIVLEQLNELDVLLKVADEMGVQPTAGVRIKLATEGSGRWAKSGGERSKFGLGAVELMRLLDQLDRLGRKDILKLVHFHLGSQITDIRYVKAGLEEIGRYYAELREHGLRPDARGRGRRPGRGLRRVALDPARQHELLHAGVRQRRGLHPRHGVPDRGAADAAPHLANRAARSPRTTRCC